MLHEKVVALYDTVAHADAAVKTLRSAGYPTADISVITNEGLGSKAELSEPGFWQRLFGDELSLREGEVYGRTVRQGGAVVSIRVAESEAARVIDLLDAHQPVDLVDRTRAYFPPQAPKIAVPPPTQAPIPSNATLKPSATALKKDEEVMRLAEEQLNVGKRTVESGKTRVRRFVIERPVEANVTLHEEHVEVMRRAITDSGYLKDVDWSEQVIEVTDTAEQPIVDKTVRVTEEVVIRRKGADHIETVRDKVRRQQIDIEQLPVETVKK